MKWIRGLLADRKQRVIVNGESSTWSDVSCGIPQGSVLGPVLFVVYINTMVESVTDSELYLFADDAKVNHSINNEQDSLELQADLDKMCKLSESSPSVSTQKNVCGWELGGQSRIKSKITSCMASNNRLWTIKLPTLAYRWYRGDMIEVSKVTHSIYDVAASRGLLEMDQGSITRGHRYKTNKMVAI